MQSPRWELECQMGKVARESKVSGASNQRAPRPTAHGRTERLLQPMPDSSQHSNMSVFKLSPGPCPDPGR